MIKNMSFLSDKFFDKMNKKKTESSESEEDFRGENR